MAIILAMSSHSIAETKDRLSELVARAEKGEEITITRHGRPVARLTSTEAKPKSYRITKEDVEWLDKHRVGKIMPKEDAASLVRRLRDED